MSSNSRLFAYLDNLDNLKAIIILGITMVKAASFNIGGHITLFFTIEKEGRLLRNQGSRGVGFNVTHGVKVSISERLETTEIEVLDWQNNPIKNDFTLYHDLIDELRYSRLLPKDTCYHLKIKLDLPTSQGFGMSAAGLVAVGLCFRELTKLGNRDQYFRIAHRIERLHGSGLGDVLGIFAGGVEIRLQPGAPGASGRSLGFACNQPILLVWKQDEPRHTSSYIDDENWSDKITKSGFSAIKQFIDEPWNHKQWNSILTKSRDFSANSELIHEPERKELLETARSIVRELELQELVSIRLCMLGISIAILPRKLTRKLTESELSNLEKSFTEMNLGCKITNISDSV